MRRLLIGAVAVLALTRCASPSRSPRPASALTAAGQACAHGVQPLAFGRPLALLRAPRDNPLTASCLRRDSVSCLFGFELGSRSDLRVALSSAGFDGALALFTSPVASAVLPERALELACVDDMPLGDTQHARLDLSLDPGSYTLAVLAAPGQSGEFELFAEVEPLPAAADVCQAAVPLRRGVPERGSTRGGASTFSAGCASRGAGPDQVYALQLERPERVRLRMQSEFEALLSIRSRCEAGESELACSPAFSSQQPVLNAELPAGRHFVIVDGALRGEGGDYVLALETAPVPAVRSEEEACAGAARLQPGAERHEVDTFYSTATSHSSCGGEGAPDTSLTFRLASAGKLTVYVSDFEFEPVFSLRRACEYIESELLCVPWERPPGSDLSSAEFTALSLDLPAGEYALVIDGQSPTSMGAGSVRIGFEPQTSRLR